MFPISRIILIVCLVVLLAPVAHAQQAPPPVPPQAAQFDFWLGDWDAAWGENLRGTNHVTKRWDRVIMEEFDGKPGMPLVGISLSAYDTNAQRWKQTWVDNEGSYLDFTGGFEDGRMTLSRIAHKDGKPIHQRMVWHDITPDAFTWNWERSLDEGKTWEVQWQIRYTRRK